MSGSQYFNSLTRKPYAASGGCNQYDRSAVDFIATVGAGTEYWDQLRLDPTKNNTDVLGLMSVVTMPVLTDGFIPGSNYILQCERSGLYYINLILTYRNTPDSIDAMQLETTLQLRRSKTNGLWDPAIVLQNCQLVVKPVGDGSKVQSQNLSVMVSLNKNDRIMLLVSNKSEANSITINNLTSQWTTQLII